MTPIVTLQGILGQILYFWKLQVVSSCTKIFVYQEWHDIEIKLGRHRFRILGIEKAVPENPAPTHTQQLLTTM